MFFHAEKQKGVEKEGYHNPHLSPAGFTSLCLSQFIACLSSLTVHLSMSHFSYVSLLLLPFFLCITISIARDWPLLTSKKEI